MIQQSLTVKQEQGWASRDGIRLLLPQGIIGFHELKHYVLIPIMNGELSSPFWLLKSHEYQELAFILLENKAIRERITFDLMDVAAVAARDGIDVSGCDIFFVTTIDRLQATRKHTTVNLRAPVLIDFGQKHAWQVILTESRYPIDYQL